MPELTLIHLGYAAIAFNETGSESTLVMKSEPFTEMALSVDLPKLATITTQRGGSNSLRDAQHVTLKSIPLTNHSHIDIPSLTTIYLPTAFKNTQFITSSSTPILLFSQIDISKTLSQLIPL